MNYLDALRKLPHLLVLLALASGCAGRHAKTPPPTMGPPTPPGFPEQTAPPVTEAPVKPPEEATPPPSQVVRPVERPHIALALGGAGIASFGTVGLLKRLHEEGVTIDYIVATGWPAVFALGYGFLNSVHDLEWFAMRLSESDFSADRISSLIERSFRQNDLSESRVPVFISAANAAGGEGELVDRGDWKAALLNTMNVPGLSGSETAGKSTAWLRSLQGIDVTDAVKKGDKTVVAISMYHDYLKDLAAQRSGDKSFRMVYTGALKKSLRNQMREAALSADLYLNRKPNDFAAKRAAIQAGYKEGARLAKKLRSGIVPPP